MKNHYVLSLKLQAQTGLHKDSPSTTSFSKDKQPNRSPIKIEESCNSARNLKGSPINRPFVYEPIKSGSFVSSLLSPNQRYANIGSFPLSSNKPTLNFQKHQEKHGMDGENQESMSKPVLGEHPLLNNYKEVFRNNSINRGNNMGSFKESLLSPSAKNSFNESLKNISVSNHYNLASNISGLAAEKNFSLEESSARKMNQRRDHGETSPPSRINGDYMGKASSKSGSNVMKGAVQTSCSPKKSFLDSGKGKYSSSLMRKENLLSKLKAENSRNYNSGIVESHYDDKKGYASPSYKKDSFIAKQFSGMGIASPVRKMESQNTSMSNKYSYLKDKTRADDRSSGHFHLKKDEKPTDDLLNRYFKNKQRPDSSFDRHHINSIKSMDFYQSPNLEQKLSTSKILKNANLDVSEVEDKGKRDSTGEEWSVLNDKSKKNFLNFHKIFAENNKRVSFHKEEGNSQAFSRIVSAVKLDDENPNSDYKPTKNPETNPSAKDLDTWMTPSSLNALNEKGLEVKEQVQGSQNDVQESTFDSQQVPVKELGSRRYPNTTKHIERRRIDFGTPLEGQSTNELELKGLSNFLGKSGDADSELNGVNRSLTPLQGEKSGSWIKKNKKSRTLINDELEEKIAQLEKKRIDLYQGYQANDVLKNLYAKGGSASRRGESEKGNLSGQKVVKEGQLKELYMRVKEGFEKMKVEKNAWMSEKSELLGKIEGLEKTVAELREQLLPGNL